MNYIDRQLPNSRHQAMKAILGGKYEESVPSLWKEILILVRHTKTFTRLAQIYRKTSSVKIGSLQETK